MRFADPILLALIAAIPLLVLLKLRLRRAPAVASFSNLALFAGYRTTWRIRYRWLPSAMRALALIMVVIALARPQTGQAESELPGRGIDIALVLDTSSSMSAGYLGDDSRMVVAKRVLQDFVKGRENDQIGLVIFRERSLVLSPLTLDYEALDNLLGGVDQLNLPDGTAIGIGLADGIELLRESKSRSRVVVLLTDGENNAGSVEPLVASRIAETLGIRVYTIGAVTRTSGNGANVDERALQEMAELTGGRYFPAESEDALTTIYASIDELEKSRVGRPQFGAYNELAVYFLAAALVLLLAEVLLRATAWRRTS